MNWKALEEKWQKRWDEAEIFQSEPRQDEKKFFITIAFPYPNMPFHVGHGRPYTLTDVYARYMRMRGYNVLFPMAFHYTGTPILAIAKRVAAEEKELIEELRKTYKVPDEKISSFVVPLNIAKYFQNEIKESMKALGYSIDWRREFTTIDPQFNHFVEWQFRKLQSKNLITRGSHPVGWCPNCGNPLGQHDTKGDMEPEIGELVLIKFKLSDMILPTGTLRPETIFGVTNLWIRPDEEYIQAQVDGERWLISKECAAKLTLLEKNVTVLSPILGKTLIGKMVQNPLTDGMVPILPASFVDPGNATGVVMSVPAHAPFDWIALEDLKQEPKALAPYSVDSTLLIRIVPIPLISLEGHSTFPAQDVLVKLGVKNQMDGKVEVATKEVYNEEFHKGKMKENTGKYAGLGVAEARDLVRAELLREGKASQMHELLNRPVYCRCGTEAVVKVLKDQWFINYGDEKWKAMARECLSLMKIVPEDLRVEFENIIEWLREKACARRQGMGTKLPWDTEWIIESLSDSVIYMAYYTLTKHINTHKIRAEQLNDSVFDYLLLDEGHLEAVAENSGLDAHILEEMQDEFSYFYPLDSRDSGRDLIPNHLTFFIFNHAALFPKELWPKQIVVTGSVLMEGKKMSKSLGNIIPLSEAVKEFGADPFRLTILSTAELLQDADFSPSLARALGERLERLYSSSIDLLKTEVTDVPLTALDRWMLSRLQEYMIVVTGAMDSLRFREAIHNVVYLLDQDVQWYLRRKNVTQDKVDGVAAKVLGEVLRVRVLLLAPFTPHLCEEIWEAMGGKGFISMAEWPIYDEKKIDLASEESERLIRDILDDTANIMKATGLSPKRIVFYVASDWKWKAYLTALKMAEKETLKMGSLMNQLMHEPSLRSKAKQIASFTQKIVDEVNKTSSEIKKRRLEFGVVNEFEVLERATDFFGRELGATVEVYDEEESNRYDPKSRAAIAQPYRPAIYIE